MADITNTKRDTLLQQLAAAGWQAKHLDRMQELQELLLPSKVTLQALVEAGLKVKTNFSIISHTPATMNRNITTCAELFGISKQELIEAALKQPPLFYQSPGTLDANLTTSANLFGISKQDFIKAALKQPQLFSRSPKTLDTNVTTSANLIGISKPDFIKAALKNPPLFYQSPGTLAKHAYYIKQIMRHMGEGRPFTEMVIANPIALSLSSKNLLGRTILAHQQASPVGGSASLLNISKTRIHDALTRHYIGQIATHKDTGEPLEAGKRVLQTLHHIGALDSLPEGMEPLSDQRSLSMLERVMTKKSAAKNNDVLDAPGK